MVGLVRLVPIIFFSIAGGTVADAWDRRRVMLSRRPRMARDRASRWRCSRFRGLDHPWPIYALAAVGAARGAFDGPARQSLMPTLVPREHLPNAISLNAIMFQIASVAGPVDRRARHRHARRRMGLRRQRGDVPLRHRRAADDARRAARATAGDIGDVSVRAVREGLRLRVLRRRSSDRRCCWTSSRRSSRRPRRCCRSSRRTCCTSARRGYGWLYAAPSVGAVLTSVVMVRSIERIERRGIVLLWAVGAYGAGDDRVRLVALVLAHVPAAWP